MKVAAFRTTVLLSALALKFGVAHAAYSTYTEAIEAARAQFQKSEYEGAQKTTEEALALAKTPSEKVGALVRLGLTYSQRKLYGQAREKWTAALQLPDASAAEKLQVRSAIALSYGEQNNWGLARVEYQKIVATPEATMQDKAIAQSAIGATFVAEKNEAEARNTFLAIAEDISLDASVRASAYTQVASSFSRAREFDKARAILTKALGLSGVSAELSVVIQAGIAESFKAEGNTTEAQKEFSKAQIMALTQSKVLSDRKQFSSARALLELSLSYGSTKPVSDAGTRMQIGELLLVEGNPSQARQRFEEVRQKQYGEPLSPEDQTTLRAVRQSAQLAVARSYVQEQNKAQAKQILNALLESENLHPR